MGPGPPEATPFSRAYASVSCAFAKKLRPEGARLIRGALEGEG
jgi:hypothetical protein